MCFSATASFIASGALTTLGVATYMVARKKDKILVAIPLMFGVQQGFEGVQWLYLNRGSSSPFAGYGFLFFALIVWPVYVPAFVWMLDKKRKKLLSVFVFLGAAVALYLLGLLLTQPLHIRERTGCVNYTFNFTADWIVVPFYMLAIFGALFFSSRPIFRWFGVAILSLSLFSWGLYYRNFISVWCFFAAVVSSMFFLYIQRKRSVRFQPP